MEVIKNTAKVLIAVSLTAFLIQQSTSYAVPPVDQEVELYYFGIDNCYFCVLQKPLIIQLNTNGFNFEIIDATRPTARVQHLLNKYAVTKYPTVIIAKKDGSVIRIVGFRPLKVLREALK